MFALKRAQLVAFLVGDAKKMLKVAKASKSACAGKPYYHGMLAFSLEQNGKLKKAEREGKRAVDISPDDPWAHHAVAHALYFQGKLDEGIERFVAYVIHLNPHALTV